MSPGAGFKLRQYDWGITLTRGWFVIANLVNLVGLENMDNERLVSSGCVYEVGSREDLLGKGVGLSECGLR